MKFTDNRGRRIVYVSRCLLNQNSRYPGIAIRMGAMTELIQILLNNEIGIEQLPCPECLYWGGVARKDTYRMQRLVFKSAGKIWFPLAVFLFNFWLYKTKRLCKKEARRVVDGIEDFVREGYSIVGIVGVNDSPTCGVTRTLNLLDIIKKLKSLNITLEVAENPHIDQNKYFVPAMQIDGSGAFLGSLMNELGKRRIDIKTVGLEPWAEPGKEAERIGGLLNLNL